MLATVSTTSSSMMDESIVKLRAQVSAKLGQLIDEIEEVANHLPFRILALYNEAKILFEAELPGENFDSILNSKARVVIQITYDKKQRLNSKLKALEESPWALSESDFVNMFGWDMIGSIRFLDNLLKFTNLTTSETGLPLLQTEQHNRRTSTKSHRGVDKSALWQPIDVQVAMEKLEQGSIHSNITVRNTSGKRSVSLSVGFEEEDNNFHRKRNNQRKKGGISQQHIFARESSPLNASLQPCSSEAQDDRLQEEENQACSSASTDTLQKNMKYRVERADQKNNEAAVNQSFLLILALTVLSVRNPSSLCQIPNSIPFGQILILISKSEEAILSLI